MGVDIPATIVDIRGRSRVEHNYPSTLYQAHKDPPRTGFTAPVSARSESSTGAGFLLWGGYQIFGGGGSSVGDLPIPSS